LAGFDSRQCWVLEKLAVPEMLPLEYRDHKLKGEWRDFRECHLGRIGCSSIPSLISSCGPPALAAMLSFLNERY
jgi:hypothetical protein